MTACRLRVLLAEKRLSETGIILRSICAEAGWALEMAYIGTKVELPGALQAHCPDVALLDLSLLQPDAPRQVSVLSRASLRVPLILFAEPADKPCAVECLSAGARDYLLEGFMDERTVARVLRSVVGVEQEGSAMLEQAEMDVGGKRQLSQSLERADEIAVELERRTVPRISQDLIKVLKRNLRTKDQIVPRRGGQVDLVLGEANERGLASVVKRLRSRLEAYEGSVSLAGSSVVTVRVGRNAMEAQPLNQGICGCASGEERSATGEFAVEEWP